MRPILGGMMPVQQQPAVTRPPVAQQPQAVPAQPMPVQPVPAATQPPVAAPAQPQGLLNGLFQDPYRMQLLLAGLGMAFSDTANQQGQFAGMANNSLLDRSRWERDAPSRERDAEIKRLQAEKMAREGSAYDQYQQLLDEITGKGTFGKEDALEMAGLPGYEGAGLSLYGSLVDTETDANAKVGPFANQKDYWQAQREYAKTYQEQSNPFRNAINNFAEVTNIVKDRGGFDKMTGADDVALIKMYAKSILAKEAVMSDDVEQVISSSGLPGSLESYMQAFKGQGQLGKTQREEIYRTMSDFTGGAVRRLNELRQDAVPAIQSGQFDPNQIFRTVKPAQPFGLDAPKLFTPAPEEMPASPQFDVDDPSTWLMPWEE